ncbi:MAG: cytochrome c oxidase subunit 4, partial [Candidatus Eremiobacteraeota bacterium]|nr:cytochrome c oxidase subunit 4 [Candidatus Eremiobacteraeota bacterium]
MKTFVVLFAISSAFGAATWIAYYFVAHEETVGTTLLAFMTAALAFAAGYALVAERAAHLEGDEKEETMEGAAGEVIGTVTKGSAYPILASLAVLSTLVGLLWVPLLAGIGLVALTLSLWRMGAESART